MRRGAAMPPSLVVFDCDGTLVDSEGAIVTAMAAAFAAAGLPAPPAAAVRHVVGLSLRETMVALVPGAAAEVHAGLVEHYRVAFAAQHADGSAHGTLFPGAVEALARLGARGHLLGVATGKSRRGLHTTLGRHGLDGAFVTVQTADDAPSKPHPAMIERAMAETGAVPGTTVLVGDTAYDMAMACAAGVGAVGVAWGYHDAGDLRAAGARRVIASFDELDDAVDSVIAAGDV